MSVKLEMASRRGILKTVGAGIALGGTYTGTVAASDGTTISGETTASGETTTGDETTAGDETFLEQLSTVLTVTQKYQNLDVAKDDGYEKFGVAADPPVGHVYEKSEYWNEEEFVGKTDITEPPALLFYAPISGENDDDEPDLVLAGVEYTVSGDQTSAPPNLFADEEASHELAVTEEEGWHRSPAPDVHDVTGLHVWLHLGNPDGVFRKGHPLIEHLVSE